MVKYISTSEHFSLRMTAKLKNDYKICESKVAR